MKKRLDKLLLCGLVVCALAMPVGFAEDDGSIEPAPETPAPATPVPVTPEPITPEPATPEPATPVPATEEPATAAPATDVPAIQVPETAAPSTDVPTQAPETTAPSTDAPGASPSVAPAETPGATPTPVPSAEPSVEATLDPSASPSEEPTSAPTPEPTLSPSADPSLDPSAEPSLEPSVEPSLSPSPSPSATPLPTPGAIEGLITITPEGDAQLENDVWRISLGMPDAPLAFSWTASGEYTSYLVYVQAAQDASLNFIEETGETRIELDSTSYASGQYTLYVGAVLADGSTTWGRAMFELNSQPGGFPGGFPGGGFGGGRPSGGFGASGDMLQEEQGFGIIPGQALTSKHASGSMDDTAYTHSEIDSTDEAVSTLMLDSTQSEIILDGGASSFFVSLEEGKLHLTPEDAGETWHLSALALQTLAESDVSRVVFQLDNTSYSLPTQRQFSGSVYASLRAQGYVSKDMTYCIDAQGIQVHVAGGVYLINESGELVPLEG